MELTLERELMARVFMHKVAMAKSLIASKYLSERINKGGLLLAQPFLEEEAVEYADRVLPELICEGKLEEIYQEAWEFLSQRMPDNYSVMREDLQD